MAGQGLDFGCRVLAMTISAPSSSPARPTLVQPWTMGLVGVVAILLLLVGLTL